MSPSIETVKEDLTFLRGLAEQGRRGPILGGTFLAAAGFIYGVACLVQWAVVQQWLPIPPDQNDDIWLAANGLFAVVWLGLFWQMRRGPRIVSTQSSAFGAVWMACGIGICLAVLAIYLCSRTHADAAVQGLYTPIVFAFYGTAWFSVAATARRRWMFLASAVSFLVALVAAILPLGPNLVLLMAVALVLTLGLPGLKLTMDRTA